MSGVFFRSSLKGRNRENPTGAAGLMSSFLGWRRAFKSVMRRGYSQFSAGPVRTMNCDRRFSEQVLQHVLAGAAVGAMTLANPALAADLPVKAPQFRPAFDWSGFY